MAWARKKSSERQEPKFGLAASLASLRLNPQDRIAAADVKPKKSSKAGGADDTSRERKPSASRTSKKRSARTGGRSGLFRVAYWTAVLGLWGAIATVGVIIWVGAHLPAI